MPNALILSTGFVDMALNRAPGRMRLYSSFGCAARLASLGYAAQVLDDANWRALPVDMLDTIDLLVVDTTLLVETSQFRHNLTELLERYPTATRVWLGHGASKSCEAQGFIWYQDHPEFCEALRDDAVSQPTGIYGNCIESGEHLAYAIYRGCRFRCRFCNVKNKGAAPAGWSAERLDADFSRFARAGIGGLEIIDFALNDYREKFDLFMAAWQRHLRGAALSCQARMDQMTEMDMGALLDAGLVHLTTGVESRNVMATKIFGKPTGAPVLDKLRRLRDLAGGRVLIGATFIIGSPADTPDDANELVDWLVTGEGRELIDMPWLNILQITTPEMARLHDVAVPENQTWWLKKIPQHDLYQPILDRFWASMEQRRPGYAKLDQFALLPLCNELGRAPRDVIDAIRNWDFADRNMAPGFLACSSIARA